MVPAAHQEETAKEEGKAAPGGGDPAVFEPLVRLRIRHTVPLQPAERLHDWLNLADLVLPSKLLGILGRGRPVVASAPANSELGQIAEQVGLRVEPEDGAGFAGAVRQLEGKRSRWNNSRSLQIRH